MAYHLHKHVRDDDRARAAFNALAGEVFGLSFEEWYRQGCWTDRFPSQSVSMRLSETLAAARSPSSSR